MTCKRESDGVPVSHSIRAGAQANACTLRYTEFQHEWDIWDTGTQGGVKT
jgi:hypothetical protein